MNAATSKSIVDSFVHEALFYADIEHFLAEALAFVHDGLACGQPVLVAVPEPRLSLLRGRLDDAAERVRWVDMAEAGRNPNRILPWVLSTFVHEHQPRRARIVGEALYAGRTPEEIVSCVQHEALTNIAFAGAAVSILCLYDVAGLADVLPYAEWTHPAVAWASGRRPSTNYLAPRSVVALLNQPLLEPKGAAAITVFDARGLAGVRAQVAKIAERAGLTAARVADFQLAATEIATNALTHARVPTALTPAGAPTALTPAGAPTAAMRLWAESDRVVCEISCASEILDPMAGRVIPRADSPRGRGLLVANQLCDLVQTHTGPAGTVTRLHMRLSYT